MKQRLDEALSNVRFDERMEGSVRQKIEASKEIRQVEKRSRISRRMQLVLAACLCMVMLTGVCFAMDLPQRLFSQMGIVLEPVNLTSVSEGIELNVLGAAADQDSAEVYFTLRDLKGDRISEKTSVYDFRLTGVGVLGCIKDGYDPETKTAAFHLEGDAGKNLKGKKIKLSLTSLIDGDSDLILNESNLSPAEILKEQETAGTKPQMVAKSKVPNAAPYWNCQNEEGIPYQKPMMKEDQMPLLPIGTMNLKIPGVDWATITNLGYQDGWLHIQARYDLNQRGENHGYLCLIDGQGQETDHPILNQPYLNEESYLEEFIIRVEDPADLAGLRIGGSFTDCGPLLKGDWNAAFRLDGMTTEAVPGSLTDERGTVDRIELSMMGVTLYGTDSAEETGMVKNSMADRQVSLKKLDGGIVEAPSARSVFDGTDICCKYRTLSGVDPAEITAVIIDGREYPTGR